MLVRRVKCTGTKRSDNLILGCRAVRSSVIRRWCGRIVTWCSRPIGIRTRSSPFVSMGSHRCRRAFGRSVLFASVSYGTVGAMRNRLGPICSSFRSGPSCRRADDAYNDSSADRLLSHWFHLRIVKSVYSTRFHAYRGHGFGHTG